MTNFNILHINSARTWRGGEQQTLYLASGLQRRGHKISIACQPGSPLETRARDKGLRILPVRMRGEGDLLAVAQMTRRIKKERFQIVHLHTGLAHTLGLLAAKIAKGPKVIFSRRVCTRIGKNPLSQVKYFKGLDRIIAISEGIRKLLIGDGIDPDQIAVIHDGIDLNKFGGTSNHKYLYEEFDLNPENPIVGVVAALTSEKGHINFLEASLQVKREFPQTKFLIVGEGRLRRKLDALAQRLGLGNSVIFTGFRDDVPQILSTLDLFVMPSHREGLGTSILDAMASQLPVVATRVGGIPEVVKSGVSGILVPPRNSLSLAKAIVTLLEDKERAARMGKAGRRLVEEDFTVDRMVAQTQEVYSQLWHQREPRRK